MKIPEFTVYGHNTVCYARKSLKQFIVTPYSLNPVSPKSSFYCIDLITGLLVNKGLKMKYDLLKQIILTP